MQSVVFPSLAKHSPSNHLDPLGCTVLEHAATLESQDNNHVRKADKEEVQQLLAPGALIIVDPLKDLSTLESLKEVFERQGKMVFGH